MVLLRGITQPRHRGRHGRHRAWFEPLLIQLMPPMGAPCRGDHAGTSVLAEGLADGENPLVSAEEPPELTRARC